MLADILDGCPDDGQATHLGRKHVDLIGALPHIAEETFNGVGRLNVPVHRLRKLVKGQRLVFLLSQASHRFWIAFATFGLTKSISSKGRVYACSISSNSPLWGVPLYTIFGMASQGAMVIE